MKPGKNISSLELNIWNQQVGRFEIGSSEWEKALLAHTDALGFEELANLPRSHGKLSFSRPKFSKRVEKALGLLRQTPRDQATFITTVNAIALSQDDALAAVEREGQRLERFIRNRFQHAMFILFPEVDLLLAKNVELGLLRDRSWREGLSDNHLVFKVHFHGIIYVPGMGPRSIEACFKTTKGGKRSRFSGCRQVRAIEMWKEPESEGNVPHVMGIAGYATKTHYRPPVGDRMLEGFPEWLWLTHQITSDSKLIRIGGVNGPLMKYCRSCAIHHSADDSCNCPPITKRDCNFYEGTSTTEIDEHVAIDTNQPLICGTQSLSYDKQSLTYDKQSLSYDKQSFSCDKQSISSYKRSISYDINSGSGSHCDEIKKQEVLKKTRGIRRLGVAWAKFLILAGLVRGP